MKVHMVLVLLCFIVSAWPVFAGDDAHMPNLVYDDASEWDGSGGDTWMTDSDRREKLESLQDAISVGPTAHGVVYSNGSKTSGTPNWNSSYNGSYKRYEISISGESYYYLHFATIITPAGDRRYCRTSSVSGKLLVYCYDKYGNPATSRFGFVTYKRP